MANTAGLIDIKLRAGFDKGAMNTAQREVGKNMQLMANRSKQAGMAINSTIAMSILPFGAALAGAFGFGAAAAIKFEEQFAAVKKTLDVAGEGAEVEAAFKNIAKQLRNIAKVSPASIQELTQIAAVGGQLGIAAKDIVTFTDTIQKLTVATNMGAEDAAMALARLQKITNLSSDDIDNLGSVIVRLGNNFATTESEIVTAATQIATATAGISTEFNNSATDAIAFATALRAVGQPAQAGSTAIIRLIQVVKRLNLAGGTQLEQVANTAGMTVQQFQELFDFDPAKGIALFIEGLGRFEKEGKDVQGLLRDLNLDTLRTSRALMALARAEGTGDLSLIAEALGMANEEFTENTALLTEAERRYETVASQLKILKNVVNENAISFGEKFLPQINNIVEALTNFITSISNLEGLFKTVMALGRIFGAVFVLPLAIIQGMRAITASTQEYAIALEFARNARTKLSVAEQSAIFSQGTSGPGGLILNPKMGRQKGLRGFLPGGGQRFEGVDNMMQGPTKSGQQLLGGPLSMVKTTKMMAPAFRETSVALGKLQKASGKSMLAFLAQNGAFRDSALFTANMDKAITDYNTTAGQSIVKTGQLKGGLIGLASATKALRMAFVALGKQIVIIGAIMGAITLITRFFERRGAAKRGFDVYSQGLTGVTGKVRELAQAEKDLQALRAIETEANTPQADAVAERIKQQEQAIAGLRAKMSGEAGGLLQTLLFGQKGGKGLENQLDDAAELAGIDAEAFKKNIFASLSSLTTDIQSGKLPTVGTILEQIASAGTGDAVLNKAITDIQNTVGLKEGIDIFGGENAFREGSLLGLDFNQTKALKEILKGYEEVFEQVTNTELDSVLLEDTIGLTNNLVKATGQNINAQQKLLIDQGLLARENFIDATHIDNLAAGQEQVSRIVNENIDKSSEGIKAFEDDVMSAEFGMLALAKTIDDTIQGHMDSAINAMNKLPEAARMTGIEYSKNLIDNIAIASEFEDIINQISESNMLLAKNLADQGVGALNIARDFLNNPQMAADAENLLSGVVGTELALQAAEAQNSAKEQGEKVATAITEGIVKGLEDSSDDIVDALQQSIIEAIEGAKHYLDSDSPSKLTRDEIGIPIVQGIAEGIQDGTSMIQKNLIAVIKDSIRGMQEDFNVYTEFTSAQRAIVQAQANEITSQQSLNRARRDAASITDRLLKAEKDLAIAEVEGRAGNITISEEIGLLRKKISLEKQIKQAGGNKSARELLQIQKAEENIVDLRAMASKGVISNLELQAAEEELAGLKGTDVTSDERKLMILELAQAESELQKAKEKALEIDSGLVSLRETVIGLKDEEALVDANLTIAENALAAAKERTVNADIKLALARNQVREELAYDGEFMSNLRSLQDIYGGIAVNINAITTNNGSMVTSLIEGAKSIQEAYAKTMLPMGMTLYDATLSGMMGSGEYNTFKSGMPQIPDYGMGGRVTGYKYGGRGDPMTRALVGEYGPEEVRFVPGSGFLVKPLGTGSSGTVVNSLNVNVTGVPSDPISARKAAVQISKALRKLDKEGSSGSGLRRN